MPKVETKKPKRQKKRKSRTEVLSDSDSESSDSSPAKTSVKTSLKTKQGTVNGVVLSETPNLKARQTDEQVKSAFTQLYMQRATLEFAEELDKVRDAEDFKGVESVEVLVRALKQGVDGWSVDEMKRVVGDGT